MNNIHKLQKPLCSKVNKHLRDNYCKKDLYGQLQEVPAVFSHTTSFEFAEEVSEDKIQDGLKAWVEDLKQWALQNKYFIGHIKVFAESGKNLSLWISTTGKTTNIKALEDEKNSNIKEITINITAIVFRTDEQTLKSVSLKSLYRNLPQRKE